MTVIATRLLDRWLQVDRRRGICYAFHAAARCNRWLIAWLVARVFQETAAPFPHRPMRYDCRNSLTFRMLCLGAVMMALAMMAPATLVAADVAAKTEDGNPERTAAKLLTPTTLQAAERGLAWLAVRQRDDGSFGIGAYRGNVAVVGLSGMAFMAGGSTPDRGPHGAQASRAADYLLANTQRSGFITVAGAVSHGPMYGHGFATMYLAECYGMSRRRDLKEKLTQAVQLIVGTQNQEGGWRYYPVRTDAADISVTICQIMALRAARNAGIYVPKETVDRCVGYVKQSQNADGGFKYMLSQAGPSEFPRSAAGVVALYTAGVYEGPEITKGTAYLMRFLPGQQKQSLSGNYYYYGQYYAAQAMWHTGGRDWAAWYPAVRDELLARQRNDGSWSSSYGAEYATAMACIVLLLPDNQLPIFQR